MKYDVVVVGGRVAGSTSSLFASKAGLDVLMIEKLSEIGTPVQCGEATTRDTFKTLQIKPSPRYICTEIEGADLYAPDGTHFQIKKDSKYQFKEGYMLERKVFDKELAVESAQAGTEVMLKTTVKELIIQDKKVCGVVVRHMGKTLDIKADIVIAADGIESNIARKAGLKDANLPQDIGSCAQYEMAGLDVHPNYMQLHFGRKIAPGGFLWIFPKGGGVANVGLGVRNSPKTAYHYLAKFIKKLGGTPVEFNIGAVPTAGPIEKTYGAGIMVVGDAAGQTDPLTGAGIENAVTCGRIAGDVAAESIKNEDTSAQFLKKYEDAWRLAIGKDLQNSLKYQKIFDKLTDDDLNTMAHFLEKNQESISKISLLKFLKNNAHLLTILMGIFIENPLKNTKN